MNGVTFVPGMVGRAFSFNTTNSYVQVGDRPQLRMSDYMSIEAWIYPTATVVTGFSIIVSKEGEYEVAIGSDGAMWWAFANVSPG